MGLGEEDQLRNYVGADSCEIIDRSRYIGSDACDPDGQAMKVHKCDEHGKVDYVLVKSMFKSNAYTIFQPSIPNGPALL